jgi:hypothetical protein
MPIVKELKRKTYSHEIKDEVLKAWMRKFKELGEFGS